jgi:hypothetical protein
MSTQPRFPGIVQARAYYENGVPRLEIEVDEMKRLEKLLTEELGREPTVSDLFNYVRKATIQ